MVRRGTSVGVGRSGCDVVTICRVCFPRGGGWTLRADGKNCCAGWRLSAICELSGGAGGVGVLQALDACGVCGGDESECANTYAKRSAHAVGDPHYLTLDGISFDYQARNHTNTHSLTHTHTLARAFYVCELKNGRCGSLTAAHGGVRPW
jgi:hypothetical protein